MPQNQWVRVLVPPFIGASIIVMGWFVVSWQEDKRAIENARRQLVTRYLIEAYRTIADASNRQWEKERDREKLMLLEQAIMDVQLFGTQDEVCRITDIAKRIEQEQEGDFTELLEVLRKSLRKELQLEIVQRDLYFFRWKKQHPKSR